MSPTIRQWILSPKYIWILPKIIGWDLFELTLQNEPLKLNFKGEENQKIFFDPTIIFLVNIDAF